MKYLKYPFVTSEEGKTYIVERHRSTLLHECNHEEADTRLVLHAAKQDTDVVIVSKDTDVLVLLIWAFLKHQIAYKWVFQFEREKFVEIGSICRSLGQRVCSSLPAIHAISGCDTTSYFYQAGKVKILKKLLMDESKCELIENLGASKTLNEDSLEDVKQFIQMNVYSGKENETYVQTRIRLYQKLKEKTSLSIPPDPDSVEQAIRRCHLQVYIWKR